MVAAGVPEEVDRIVRRVALAVDQALVTATPVDTGRARSNWIVTIGRASTETTENIDKSGSGALEQGSAVVGGYTVARGPIFFSNNVPYIGFLENGSSAQAPNGMVAGAIQVATVIARNERVRIRIR